jgi:hypothetical protein
MQEILPILQNALKTDVSVSFEVLDPDLGEGYAGNLITIEDISYIYRGYKAWTDLAELLMCKMLTPKESSYPRYAKSQRGEVWNRVSLL